MQAARDRQKSYANLKRKPMEFQVGFALERGRTFWQTGEVKPQPFHWMDFHFDDKLWFVEEPIEITDREVKWLKQSRIPLVKVLMELQERSRVYMGTRRSISEEIPTSVFKDRAVVKCCVLSLEDKAQLTGGDYNTPCFRTMYDVNKVTQLNVYIKQVLYDYYEDN
ncbi:hypothetical protein Tco_0094140 [Tanacetum coccineum]